MLQFIVGKLRYRLMLVLLLPASELLVLIAYEQAFSSYKLNKIKENLFWTVSRRETYPVLNTQVYILFLYVNN